MTYSLISIFDNRISRNISKLICINSRQKRWAIDVFLSPDLKPHLQLWKKNALLLRAQHLLVLALLSGFAYPVAAQTLNVPDTAAQELLRQQERERLLRQQQEPPDVRLSRPPVADTRIPEGETPCFPVALIQLTGDSAARFKFALDSVLEGDDPALGRCLGTQGINLVLTRVQNAIAAQGYVTTRVLVAPQDLKQGALTLTVIPGRIRAVRYVSNNRVPPNALPLQAGDILNLRDIEQGLENFKRVPTAEADFQITPASDKEAQPGESDLVVTYKQAFPLRLLLSADDGGARSTGKYQGGVTLSYDNPLSLNDLFYASFNHDLGGGDAGARGTRGYNVHYSLPYGYWLLGFTTNYYKYQQSVAAASQNILFSGTSRDNEIRLSRVLYRDAVRKTTGSVRGYFRRSNNFIDDTEIEIQRRRTAGYEIGLAHREFIGPATLDASIAYRHGTGAFDALAAPEEATSPGASRPIVITNTLALNAPFEIGGLKLRYNGQVRAQTNRTPLIPQDRFSIGGRYTVRGFDGESVLSAERGWLIRNDLGIVLAPIGQEFYIGLDHGEVDGASSNLLLGKRLTGFVIGLRGGYKDFSYDVFAGQPISKPDGFKTAGTTAGFNLNWSF